MKNIVHHTPAFADRGSASSTISTCNQQPSAFSAPATISLQQFPAISVQYAQHLQPSVSSVFSTCNYHCSVCTTISDQYAQYVQPSVSSVFRTCNYHCSVLCNNRRPVCSAPSTLSSSLHHL
jgi:hypothetical protein